MYKVTKKLMNKGKRVGFEVQTENGKLQDYTDNAIKNLMRNGKIFNITYNERGFQFKDNSTTIKDLPSKTCDKVHLSGTHRTSIVTDEYTSNALKQYIDNSGSLNLKSRDFVNAIIEYCKSNEKRVLSISGLRGTGKTTGIIQSINKLGDFNNTVFINIDATAEMTCLDLRNLILTKYKNKKYIFIDEITRIKDLINNSAFLSDNLCMNGRKVIISGTDSLALTKSKNAGLYHRMININVTHISFTEAQRTANQSLREYIEMGGLYRADSIRDIDGLREYIDTAVVDNIMNTLTKNNGVESLLNISGINRTKLRTIVFRILYAVIYMNMQKIKPTSINFIIELYDHSSSSLYNVDTLNSLLCREMNVDEVINTNIQEIGTVLDAMQELGLLIKIPNLCNRRQFQYYITNPSIVNQIMKSLVDILDTTNLRKKSTATVKGIKGKIFESIVITHTKKTTDKIGYNVYYYHDNNNAEIDLIVEKITGTAFDDLYLYYEIKMTSDADTATVKARWINDNNIVSNQNGRIVGKGIIYGGETKRFKGFESNSIYPPKGMTLEQIEQQNMNIELISAEDYLKNTKSKLSILESYYTD